MMRIAHVNCIQNSCKLYSTKMRFRSYFIAALYHCYQYILLKNLQFGIRYVICLCDANSVTNDHKKPRHDLNLKFKTQ